MAGDVALFVTIGPIVFPRSYCRGDRAGVIDTTIPELPHPAGVN
jgi:hypothetical protein